MTRLSFILILLVCFLQVGNGGKSSGSSSSRGGSIGGGGWSSGGSRGSSGGSRSSSGGGWGSSSSGNIGGGGWNTGSNSRNIGGGGGWNAGGSSGGNRGNIGSGGWNTGSNSGGKKSGLAGLFGKKDSSSGGKKGILGGIFGKKKSSDGSTKKKGGKLKTLKKAAVIGAVAYGGYKLGKLTSRFSNFGHSHNVQYGFNDWNRWRQQDGFLCRNNMDCTWIDPSLECDDYKFDFSPSKLWFGGDVASIRGQCQCRNSFSWNDNDLHCLRRRSFFGSGARPEKTGIFIVLLAFISMIIVN